MSFYLRGKDDVELFACTWLCQISDLGVGEVLGAGTKQLHFLLAGFFPCSSYFLLSSKMYSKVAIVAALGAFVAAAPAPQLPTFSFATAPIAPVRPTPVTGSTTHGPYSGQPTTTGALSKPALAQTIAPLPASAPSYTNSNGELQASNMTVPYQPAGGMNTNGSEPYYHPLSDFDYESFTLALYQEWIELDLFHNGLATFSVQDFEDAGLTAEDRYLIQFMAEQEVGHATLISNILGAAAPPQCTYNYPFTTVREYVDFCQRLTRFGESGVYGFLGHLDSQAAATLLLQSITTEARQQMIFRQFNGQFPMPVWFEVGIPQSWAWTLLAPYISSCPANTTRLAWQNFPALTILDNPNTNTIDPTINANASYNALTGGDSASSTAVDADNYCVNATAVGEDCSAAITHNRTIPLSYAGRPIYLSWEDAGQPVGPNNSYVTARSAVADAPRFALFVNQLNATFVPLQNISGNTAVAVQPEGFVYENDPIINGTTFIAITSQNPYITSYNLSNINSYVYAGPALYAAG